MASRVPRLPQGIHPEILTERGQSHPIQPAGG
jgi:hypothetical protein